MNKKTFLIFALVLLAIILAGCANQGESTDLSAANTKVQPITAEELRAQLDAGLDENTVIVDVREPFLYEENHIPGAILIPFAEFEKEYEKLDKNKKIILVCHMGPMGEASGQFLISKGYKQVYNLEGGMRAWEEG
ncbi:rhodanese-like domain-containing protein [Microaerobacter geothermalis]|uniref:rhodanese-like domain-containing protein n=1 Tax=Microaerobacter geothermalis TaxID=674972 RepID=UPI001F46A442|nr:rhodanese-like domain-containing protein [Microaerobacter geothermalis]MCF6094155.1 rhodanese-like domain-containing protein [Microaerobacter geothermalis]